MTAQAIAAAVGATAHGVCTHDVLASQCDSAHDLITITQARRREPAFSVYVGLSRVTGPEIASLDDIIQKSAKAKVVATIDIGVPPVSLDPLALVEYFLRAQRGDQVRGAGLLPPVPIYLRPADVREPIDLRGKALRAAINQ
jgi:tRNA A37 threonylcarbamoyladenosine modification protein TsaB